MVLTPIPPRDAGRIQCRAVLLATAGLVVVVGLTVLALKIAVYFYNRVLGPAHLDVLTIISGNAVIIATVSGLATVVLVVTLSGKGYQTSRGARRNFLICAVIMAFSTLVLLVAASLTFPSNLNWWDRPILTRNIFADPDPPNPGDVQLDNPFFRNNSLQPVDGTNMTGVLPNDVFLEGERRKADERQAALAVRAQLKWAALSLTCILSVLTMVCTVISLLNYRRIPADAPEVKYHLAPRESTAYQDPRVDRMITDL